MTGWERSDWRGAVPGEIFWTTVDQFRFRRGDDPGWSAKALDDSGWSVIGARDLPSRDGIYWVRWRVTQRAPQSFLPRDGLLLKVVASYDLYWDGHLIGRNGLVGPRAAEEEPGLVDALFQIPRELLGEGEHVVALRLSSFHTGFPGPSYGVNFLWGNFRTMLVERSRTALLSVMAVGAALVGAVVFGLMWLLAGRRRAVLLFSLLCLVVAALQALQAWRWIFEYSYDWHYPRLLAITGLATAMAALLPAFLMEHFSLRGRRRVYAVLALAFAAAWYSSPIYNRIGLTVSAVGFGVALALATHAARVRRRGAGIACGGLAVSLAALVAAPRDFLDHAFFLSAGPGMLGLLIAFVLQLREERREARQAVLAAARLETELLKKNIQPHFLLNTLATIIEVIEQDPRTAVGLIEALASEFQILARVSGEKRIPLEQELELCRAHLRVMSRRKGVDCALGVRGPVEGIRVPPALLHTLIENGLTHLLPDNGRQDFELGIEPGPAVTRLVLLARGRRMEPAPGTAPQEGTGLRYIKARLEESFTGGWSLAGGPVPAGWETVIEFAERRAVPDRAPAAAVTAAGGGQPA